MWSFLINLIRPGVLSAGLWGTAAQVALGFAHQQNLYGVADTISSYGLAGGLASGGLVAALTGLFYSFTPRATGQALATGAGATAGAISGTLGTGINQALGLTPLAEGATPIFDFAAMGAAISALTGTADPGTPVPGIFEMADVFTVGQVFGTTAAGGGVGAFLGRMLVGKRLANS
ncbi:MAG: hypothetical protein HXY22_12720 [Alphaproteobacteria bacterium]|nr:hypothetical protein [Alphaproteobacteria bacterium]